VDAVVSDMDDDDDDDDGDDDDDDDDGNEMWRLRSEGLSFNI
jgi:hypothetical protein